MDLRLLKHSLFFISQACTIFHLSQASDHIGRKPIIIMGGAGMSIAMYCFGLSRTFWGLVFRYCTMFANGVTYMLIGLYKVAVSVGL